MREIRITRGMVTLVDSDDFELASRFNWCARPDGRTWYAQRKVKLESGRWRVQLLHTLITGFALTDHINGDGLDNLRANLRAVTVAQNRMNLRKRLGTSSQFKGVRKRGSRWQAEIYLRLRRRGLGTYGTESEAALAYDAAARDLFGEFAALNFPGLGERGCLVAPLTRAA